MNEIKLQILEYNYWEHFKSVKDISLILPIDHPRRKELEASMNQVLTEIHKIKGTKE